MLEEQKELTFETEEKKIEALKALQDKGVTEDELSEIERIANAKVLDAKEPDKNPDEPHDAPPVKTEEQKDIRNWNITEDTISKFNETYVDEDGRTRPIITHKDPESLLKSYVESQKHIQFLKNKKLPKEFDAGQHAGYEKARSEYETKIAALQKAQVETKKPEPRITSDSFDEYSKTIEELGKLEDGQEIEHTDKLKKAIFLSKKVIEERDQRYADETNKIREELKSFQTDWQKKQEDLATQSEAEKKRLEREQSVERLYSEIDSFIKSKDAPEEFKADQPYKEMVKDALGFHNELAELYTGKTAREYAPEQWTQIMENAGTAYLNGLPQLVQSVKENGVKEPKNYKSWVFYDNLDAIRVGFIRTPDNKWEKRVDPITGQSVNFGDIKTSYNYYLDQSGKRAEMQLKDKKKDSESLIHAMTKRDSGVVQLDESQLSASESGGVVLTEEKANEILSTYDANMAMVQAMNGNPTALNMVNAALQRLGHAQIELDKEYSLTK